MAEKKQFKCDVCNPKMDLDKREKKVPECCGRPMKEDLSPCALSDTAEHARFDDTGEPCDDGRSGKI